MHDAPLRAAIKNRTAKIAVVGLGYVGLPLLRTFVDAGFVTMGFDSDDRKVELLNSGQSYIKHVSGGWIAQSIAQGRMSATSQMDRLGEADVVLICVPTPLASGRTPDLSYVQQTARHIAASLRPGQLIILESTTYPSTTSDLVLPLLEGNGLQCGREFFLAYSPERVDPGNDRFSTRQIPKVVGGAEPVSSELAQVLYRQVVDQVVPVSSAEVAEACKILENTYRAVNIALVNELKVLFDRMDINIWEVIEAAKTKPFGFQAFYPGPGLGGHCIPIDPFYLSWLARKQGLNTRFIELAGEVNAAMPQYVVQRVAEALNSTGRAVHGSRIAILGVAYKRDVGDPRESPAFRIMELLGERGARLSYHDPHVDELPSMRNFEVPDLSSEPLSAHFLAEQDCAVIVTDHSAFDWQFVVDNTKLIIDTRNATAGVTNGREKIHLA